MLVKFESTPEDQIDVSRRLLARSKVVASWRLKGLVYTMLFTWLLVFAFFTYFYRRPAFGALLGIAGGGLSALLYPSSHKRAVEKRLRKLHQEKFGNGNRFVCEVELTAEGVSIKQMNKQIIHQWASVVEIQDTNDSIDIFTREGDGVVSSQPRFRFTLRKKRVFRIGPYISEWRTQLSA